MNASALRSLQLAQAAIKHAFYFLELGAQSRAASYCSYAAEQLRYVAQTLRDAQAQPNSEYELAVAMVDALALGQP